uniref:Uncharacterized protein n=1 Tax=viral metagenome TaxID=1070528 RepID=A0A6M3Y4Z4_9ZZZZ
MSNLATIVKESGLDSTKAQVLLDKFNDYFKIAAEWEKKAKTIVVTNESQTADMRMARTGRLFLREKRIAIEKTRKVLKEDALREGKAIDGIANILKALIVPIESYLERQEKFVELKQAEKEARKRAAEERIAEEQRLIDERKDAEERERIRKENEILRKQIEERNKELRAKEQERIALERKLDTKEKEAVVLEQKLQATTHFEASSNTVAVVTCPFCHKSFTPDDGDFD